MGGKFISADSLKLNGAAVAESGAVAVSAPTASPKGVLSAPDPGQIDYDRTTDEDILSGKVTLKDGRHYAWEGAPTCSECGMLMVPNGACYKCENCGSTSGCS